MIQYWKEALFGFFCLITVIHIFYYLFYFLRLAFYKTKSKIRSQHHPVSVIICARDEAENLANHLPNVLQQSYPSTYEVVVVNDNSYDDSKYVLEHLAKPFKHLKAVELKQEARFIPGKKFPLSMGIKAARHEIVLLTDADCTPASADWIEKMQNGFDENIEIVLGYGAYEKKSTLLNKLIRYESFHTALQYLSYALAGNTYMGVGRNLAYKKELFFKNKGFSAHNHIPGGDDDLFINKVAHKHNTAVVIDKNAFTISSPKQSWKKWFQQKTRHYSTGKYYKAKHKFSLGLFAVAEFLFYPAFIAAMIFFNWQLSLIVFGVKFLLQSFIYFKVMSKLNETDLIGWFLFFDIGLILHYILFLPAIIKKPKLFWK